MLIYCICLLLSSVYIYWCIVSDLDAPSQCSAFMCTIVFTYCTLWIQNFKYSAWKVAPLPPPGPHTQSSDILYLCEQAMLNLTGMGYIAHISTLYSTVCCTYTGSWHYHGRLALHGVLPGGPVGVICTVMDGPYCMPCRTVPFTLAGAAQLRAYCISFWYYTVNGQNQLTWPKSRMAGRADSPC